MADTKLYHIYWMSECSKAHGWTEEADLAGFVRLTPEQKEDIDARLLKNEENAWEDDFTIEEVVENLTFDEVINCGAFPEVEDEAI